MALLKDLPDPFSGETLVGCYLKWGDLTISPRTRSVSVEFQVFRSEAAKLAELPPLPIRIAFQVGPEADPVTGAPSYADFTAAMGSTVEGQPGAADVIGALVYGYAKAQPSLAGAEDA